MFKSSCLCNYMLHSICHHGPVALSVNLMPIEQDVKNHKLVIICNDALACTYILLKHCKFQKWNAETGFALKLAWQTSSPQKGQLSNFTKLCQEIKCNQLLLFGLVNTDFMNVKGFCLRYYRALLVCQRVFLKVK